MSTLPIAPILPQISYPAAAPTTTLGFTFPPVEKPGADVGREQNPEKTLIEYAAERRDDPWWEEVYQIIHRVFEKMKSSPGLPSDKCSAGECCNCRLPLPRAAVRVKVKLKAENSYCRSFLKTLPFCSEECALQ